MSCKSAMYTANTTNQTLTAGSTVDLGSIIRRFGQNINLNGDDINVSGAGYYDINAEFVLTGTATSAATTTITLMKDGVGVQGATTSVSMAAGDVVTVGINALVREYGCCCDNNSNLSFLISGTGAIVNNASVVVEKV